MYFAVLNTEAETNSNHIYQLAKIRKFNYLIGNVYFHVRIISILIKSKNTTIIFDAKKSTDCYV